MPAKRPCPRPGCPELIGKGERACPEHRREYEQKRGSKQARGYDKAHDAERLAWASRLATGPIPCARCGQLIRPGDAFDLGHTDDRRGWTGPEHPSCNRAAGGRSAHL